MNGLLLENISNRKILFSPLNWGMGHVSRSIGLIYLLLKKENIVFIACDKEQKKVYQEYFPEIEFILHKGYPFDFKGKGNFSLDLFMSSITLTKRLRLEKEEVKKYVDEFEIDIILSDHRYGFVHEKIPSIFITHQLNLPLKWHQKSVQFLHEKLIGKFHSIWVMDFDNNSLAGDLSAENNKGVSFIGPFSRFMLYEVPQKKNNQTVYIASGPKIYLEEFIESIYEKNEQSVLIAPSQYSKTELTWREQDEIILNAKKIISRSGYSTIMDVYFLKCEVEFYPTKGQSEQGYLAKLHKKSPTF